MVWNVPKPLKNIRKDLDRLREKGEILTIRKGFYTVIPPEYKHFVMIPVEFYIDKLMNYLNKRYYVGLYSAAKLYGAAHQQPQAFFAVAETPAGRSLQLRPSKHCSFQLL